MLFFSVGAAFLTFLGYTSANCYWEDGTDRNTAWNETNGLTEIGPGYIPCDNGTASGYSMCCALWNTCQTNGLCFDGSKYWRESCSDPTWDSPDCVKLFINDTGSSDDIVVTECSDGSFCYNDKNFDCCSQSQGVFIVDGNQVAASTTTSSSSSSTTSSSTTSTSAASTTTNSGSLASTTPAPSSDGLSTGAEAGIGVGAALGALAALALLIWYLMRRRRSKAQAYNNDRIVPLPVEKGPETGGDPAKISHAADVFSGHAAPTYEMPATQPPQYRNDAAELDGRPRV